MSKWRMEYTEADGEKYPTVLWCGTQPVIVASTFTDEDGEEVPFLDMHPHEIVDLLHLLNRAEGEE